MAGNKGRCVTGLRRQPLNLDQSVDRVTPLRTGEEFVERPKVADPFPLRFLQKMLQDPGRGARVAQGAVTPVHLDAETAAQGIEMMAPL